MEATTPDAFEFGGFRLDRRRRLLLDPHGAPVHVTSKAFDLLLYLLERPGEVVERAALIEALWPKTVVEENNVNQAVAALRRQLGDGFIATVTGRGYQFVADVRAVACADAPDAAAERRTASAAPAERGVRWRRLVGGAGVVFAAASIVAALVYVGPAEWRTTASRAEAIAPAGPPAASPTLALETLAVLPCENLSPDPDDAYFAAGIHEEILNRLVQLSGLRVVPGRSVLQYAENRPPIRQIAGELSAAAVMECSVRYAGNGVLVTARLIDPLTNTHVWSQAYRGDRSDVSELFAMQADIATNIARALRAELSPAEERRINRPRTDSAPAYVQFLEFVEQRRLGLAPHTLFGYMDRAIEADREFALAYAVRGALHIDAANMGSILRIIAPGADPELFDAERQFELAREDALRALEIDPELGFAYSTLARLTMFNGDSDAAWRSHERAIELSPGDPETLRTYAIFHIAANRFHEGLELLERASQLDPNFVAPLHYAMAGEFDVAREHARRQIDENPLNPRAHLALGVLEATIFGDAETAERELRLTEQLAKDNAVFFHLTTHLYVVYAYGRLGLTADARRVYDEVLAMLPDERVLEPTARLRVHLAFGEISEAYKWAAEIADNPLPLAYRGPQAFMLNILNDPVLERPEFVELRRKLGYRP